MRGPLRRFETNGIRSLSRAFIAALSARRLAGAGIALIIVLLLLLFVRPIDTIFNVVAHTEVVEGTAATADRSVPASERLTHPVSWSFDDVTLCIGVTRIQAETSAAAAPCRSPIIEEHYTGQIVLLGPVDFTIERVARGDMSIELTGPEDSIRIDHPAGCDARTDCRVTNPVTILVSNLEQRAAEGRSIVLPFVATRLSVGRKPSMRGGVAQPLLRSARVSMLSASILGGGVFFAGEVALDEGDQFSVEASRRHAGVITTDERALLNVIYRAEGRQGSIRKFHVRNIPVSASLFERLRRDPLLAGLVSVLMGLVVIYGTIRGGR